MRCEHLHDSAVYVLGALSPPEREAYERHLADCAECRAEVAEFSDLPGLLGRLDPDIAAQIALSSSLEDSSDPEPSNWAGPTLTPPAPPPVNGHDPLAPRLLARESAVKATPFNGEAGPANRLVFEALQ